MAFDSVVMEHSILALPPNLHFMSSIQRVSAYNWTPELKPIRLHSLFITVLWPIIPENLALPPKKPGQHRVQIHGFQLYAPTLCTFKEAKILKCPCQVDPP